MVVVLVTVEQDGDVLGLGQEVELVLGHLAAHGGHDIREPGLVELHHGEEALNEDEAEVAGLFPGLVVAIVLMLMALPAFAGYRDTINIPHYWQDDRCWCAITIIEQWSDWVNGNAWSDRQPDLAETYNVPAYQNGCVRGLTVPALADALEAETDAADDFSRYWAFLQSSFVSKIVREIHDGYPVAVAGYTRYVDGRVLANMHYYLVYSFENTGANYSSSERNVRGFWLHDPVYGSAFTNIVQGTSPQTFISKDTFLRDYASRSSRRYNLVEYNP